MRRLDGRRKQDSIRGAAAINVGDRAALGLDPGPVEEDDAVVAIARSVVAADLEQLLDHARAAVTAEVEDQVDRVGDLVPRRLIWKLDAALHDTGREPGERLGCRVRVNCGQRTRMSGVQRLQ